MFWGKVQSIQCVFLLAGIAAFSAGCAIHYYDAKTGTENLWGFGHLKMKAIAEGNTQPGSSNAVVAFVTDVRTFGLGIGAGSDYGGITVGWDSRSRLLIKQDGANFCFIWPTNTTRMPWSLHNLFWVRISTNFPQQIRQ